MSRILTGRVSSDKTNKTIVVTVATRKTHPLYKKQYTINTKFMAHDEKNQAKQGDLVTIKEHRPISARKRFILDKILETAHVGFDEKDAIADIPVDQKPDDNEPEIEKITKKASTTKKASETTDKESK